MYGSLTALRYSSGGAYVVDGSFPDKFERVYCSIAKEMSVADLDFLRKIGLRP
jgi:hypothetical protein